LLGRSDSRHDDDVEETEEKPLPFVADEQHFFSMLNRPKKMNSIDFACGSLPLAFEMPKRAKTKEIVEFSKEPVIVLMPPTSDAGPKPTSQASGQVQSRNQQDFLSNEGGWEKIDADDISDDALKQELPSDAEEIIVRTGDNFSANELENFFRLGNLGRVPDSRMPAPSSRNFRIYKFRSHATQRVR